MLFCVYHMYNHCCFVYITCTVIAVLCILHEQSLLFRVYYMYNHCCFVYITGTIIAFCVFSMYKHCCFEVKTMIKLTGSIDEVNIVLRGQKDRAIKVLFIYDSLVNYYNILNWQDQSFTMYFLHHIGPEGFRKLY